MSFDLSDPAFLAACQPAGGGFDPLSIPGCVLCLMSDGNVYTTGTTQATDGQTVETWADASASGAIITQSTGSDRPSFHTGIVNGYPVLRFNGANTRLQCTTDVLSGATAATAFWVQYLDIESSTNSTTGAAVGRWGTAGSSDHSQYAGTIYNGFGSISRWTVGDPTPTQVAWRVHSVRSTNMWKYFFDGTEIFTAANSVGFRTSSPYGYIGASDDAYFFDGDIAAVLIYNSALSTTDREYVENGLGAKYGITITH